MSQRPGQTAARVITGHVNPAAFVRAVGNYAAQKRKLRDFLVDFAAEAPKGGAADHGGGTSTQSNAKGAAATKQGTTTTPYLNGISQLSNGDKVLEIKTDDILSFFGHPDGTYHYNPNEVDKAADVINTVITNTQRSLILLYEVVEMVRSEYFPSTGSGVDEIENAMQERLTNALKLPVSFRVPYEIRLLPPAKQGAVAIHNLRAHHVGSLSKIEGIVSKVSTVKPCLKVAVYRCEECGNYEFQHIDAPTFTPMTICTSQSCKTARRVDTLIMSSRDSKFVKRQEARIQEMPHLVPPGAIPRQLKIILQGELCKTITPGMAVTVGGVFLPVVERGYRHPKASQASPTVMEVHSIEGHRSVYETAEMSKEASSAEIKNIIRDTPDLYGKMAASLAPAIHGHDDVKKALLLQLVGGATECQGDGLKIRGDIHMLLMGDPGIAKSQLLLRVCSVAPRAHFTCGKGASGVGLTASVTKDPVTGEFALEGGAIVLADNGVCCVDEFDKMQEADRTAIHEVMEQQTVSISKAGLVATLNARTTILAAANPVFGRYDITKSAVANIGLPAALLSRFDIVFLLLDQGGTYEKDLNMARYLLKIHKDHRIDDIEVGEGETFKPLTNRQIRALIARAKVHIPKLTRELADEIAEHYVELRRLDRQSRGSQEESTYTTPRTLFGLLRMSQALARLRFSNNIEPSDFHEALRVIQASKQSILGARAAANVEAPEDMGTRDRNRMMELLKRIDRTRTRTHPRPGTWITFQSAMAEAEQADIPAGLVEEIVDNMVHMGTMMWDGPTKRRFKFMEGPIMEEDDDDDKENDDDDRMGE